MLGRLAPLVRRRATFASSLPAGSRGVSGVLSKSPKSPSATLRRAPVKKAVKSQSSVAWADMPASKLDANGMPIGPLDALPDAPESMRKGKKDSKDKNDSSQAALRSTALEEAAWKAALAAGHVPDTPLSKLVWENWRRFPDCILLTQVGNFFESYFEPAIEVAGLLGIKLTSKVYKSGKHPFTGFPIHQLDKYLKLLVQDLGRTVVLVEEQTDPFTIRDPKDDVERKVARVVTPGTLVDDSWLSGNESRYLLAMDVGDNPLPVKDEGKAPHPIYLAYADVSTGDFFTKEATTADIEDELARIAPREVVLDSRWRQLWQDGQEHNPEHVMNDLFSLLRALGVHVSFTDPHNGSNPPSTSPSAVYNPLALERCAIRILHHHLEYALRDNMPIMPENPEDFNRESATRQMHIDAATLQALEIRHAMRPGGLAPTGTSVQHWASPLSVKGTLLSVISRTVTDSGHRLLRRTLSAPSTDLEAINSRLSLVSAFVDREPLRTDLREKLKSTGDVMRIVQRFRSRRGDGSDVWDVAKWVRDVDRIVDRIKLEIGMNSGKKATKGDPARSEGIERLSELVAAFTPLKDLAEEIEAAIDETRLPTIQVVEEEEDTELILGSSNKKTKGETRREEELRKRMERYWIKPSFSTELEELHRRVKRLQNKQDKMQESLRETFESRTLNLTTHSRYGFVVAVRKKTEYGVLDRSEEFISQTESKGAKAWSYKPWSDLGNKLDATHQELDIAQYRALNRLRALVVERSAAIQRNAELVDEIDMTAGFAQVAVDRNFVRPELDDGVDLTIVNGRHPSVEAGLQASARMFTPNTTEMTPDSHLHVITGPNQGGKSTLLRQTAVIAILAQAGSFVPADAARIGIVDRVFSRIGARDDLFRDRSTFMLEMVETAAILKHATPRSLVIMDEIGRGTTLNAGMSIAYATLDFILKNIKCRTLFATHYHELAHMLGVPSSEEAAAKTGVPFLDPRNVRQGVSFWCTDVDELDGLFAYSYRLKPGVNYDSHAIKAAQLAGMPDSFLETAERTLQELDTKHDPSH